MFGSSLPGADINRESKWFSSGSCEQSPVQQQLRGKHGWHDAKKSRPDGGWSELADTLGVLFRRPNPEPGQNLVRRCCNRLRTFCGSTIFKLERVSS
jgi:hypothetical protein